MLTYVRRLLDERDHLTGLATATAERAASEGRDLTETERANCQSWQERCSSIDSQLTEHQAAIESQRSYANLRSRIDNAPADEPPARREPERAAVVVQSRSWGEAFTGDPGFREYSGRGSTPRITMPTSVLQTRTMTDTAAPAAADPAAPITLGDLSIRPHRFEPPLPTFRNPILEIINVEPVQVNSVEYIRWTPTYPEAAPAVVEGALKKPANMAAERVDKSLETFAHWKAITRQALEDYGRIRSIVEQRLRTGLQRSIAEGVVAALVDGNVPTMGERDSLLENIRMAVGMIQEAGYEPSAVILHPLDWALLDIAILGSTLRGPVRENAFWQLRPVPAAGIPRGTAYVGDFEDAITLFDRTQTQVFVTDSHADFFLRNQLVVLAETRALPALIEPAAVVACTGDLPGEGGGSGRTVTATATPAGTAPAATTTQTTPATP